MVKGELLQFVLMVETFNDAGQSDAERRLAWYGTDYGTYGDAGMSWDPLFDKDVPLSACILAMKYVTKVGAKCVRESISARVTLTNCCRTERGTTTTRCPRRSGGGHV